VGEERKKVGRSGGSSDGGKKELFWMRESGLFAPRKSYWL
jgi:hypothetical protein